ncbi:Na+/H+ antiporter, partial [Cryomyces antarcticus]
MALPNISVFAFILLCVVVIYKYLVHPTFLSPLSRIPNAHPSSHLSPLWILWIRYTGRENRTVFAAHESNGPVIRLGPNEVSVNCVDGGIRTVYAGGFEKHAWYANLFGNYGTPNMFSTTHSRPHSARKRMLSNVYAKSFLQSSPTLSSISSTILYERLLPRLVVTASSTNATQGIDVFQLFSALTMDFVTCYQFGLAIGSNWTQNSRECEHFLNLYRGRTSSKAQFWAGELPNLTKCFKRFGVRMVPRWVDDANAEIEAWCLSMCDAAAQAVSRGGEREEVDVGDEPVVFAQLLSAMEKEREKSSSTVSDQG